MNIHTAYPFMYKNEHSGPILYPFTVMFNRKYQNTNKVWLKYNTRMKSCEKNLHVPKSISNSKYMKQNKNHQDFLFTLEIWTC